MFNPAWYETLTQPVLSPPVWVFTPVWIFLYILILISLVLFMKKRTRQNKISGYVIFLIQMILNILWTPAFFGLKNPALALAVIILLDIAVLMTIVSFYKISKPAGVILIPYFIWITFATYLNLGILILN